MNLKSGVAAATTEDCVPVIRAFSVFLLIRTADLSRLRLTSCI